MIVRPDRRLLSPFLALAGTMLVISLAGMFLSCTPVCDYPEIRVAKLRLVNAMPDQDTITVWLNNKKFWASYPYEVATDFPFGYYDHYADGSPLVIGPTLVVVTADPVGRDTLMVDSVTLNVNRETLVIMGRAHAAAAEKNTKRVLLLDDQIRQPDPNKTLIRFIHAVPDLPDLDVHWHTTPAGRVNTTIRYGVANPYSEVEMQVFDATHQDSLIITEAGKPSHIIAMIPYAFTSKGFFVTIIIRGRTLPVGREHSASTFVLSDAQGGSFVSDFSTFGVRILNASRSLPTLSLLVKGPPDSAQNYPPRSNYPQQTTTVLDIPTDSLSAYLALTPGLNAYSHYYYCTSNVYDRAKTLDSCIVGGAKSDDRYTFVAVETAKLGSSTTSLDHLVLRDDSLTLPADLTKNRIRVVMVSPDHASITVSFGGPTQKLNFKDFVYFDVPFGSSTLTLSDGAASRNVPITVVPNRPMSVYLLPAQTGSSFPVKVVAE